MKKLIVDRIENGIAVCENDALEIEEIPLCTLPDGVKEGSVLSDNGNGKYEIDLKTEDERRKKILEIQKKLFSGKKD